jgi:dethiobiotin synthetase
MRGTCFVTATDTGVGKTIVAATIVAGLRARGVTVHARKPVITGVLPTSSDAPPADFDGDLRHLADHLLLGAVSGERPEVVTAVRYEPAVSPHLAASLAGETLELDPIVAALSDLSGDDAAIVLEGIGGLLVPFSDTWDVRRLAAALGWPVIVVARPGLGTINHTLLTLEAARHAGLDVRAVVLNPWPAEPDTIERSNRETIERLGGVEVATLPLISPLTAATLAGAAQGLPYERWLAA